jgi:hypothetical protein
MRFTNPRSIRRRIKFAPLISLAALTIFVPLLGAMNSAATQVPSPPAIVWRPGSDLWVLGVCLVPLYFLWVAKLKRAVVVYSLITVSLFPAALAILAGALRLSLTILGERSSVILALGLLLGLGTLPLVVRHRRERHQSALMEGHLRRSLDADRAMWDAQYDHDEAMSVQWLKRPGCLIRILPWVGPAIGMRLADIVGRRTTELIIVACFLFIGYAFALSGLVQAIVQLLEFRRLELELGRPIMLAEAMPSPGGDSPPRERRS